MGEMCGGQERRTLRSWKLQNDFIRGVTGFKRQDRVSAGQLRKEVKMVSVEDSLCRKRLDWLGRLIRMDGNRLVSRVWGTECEGREEEEDPDRHIQSRKLKIWLRQVCSETWHWTYYDLKIIKCEFLFNDFYLQ